MGAPKKQPVPHPPERVSPPQSLLNPEARALLLCVRRFLSARTNREVRSAARAGVLPADLSDQTPSPNSGSVMRDPGKLCWGVSEQLGRDSAPPAFGCHLLMASPCHSAGLPAGAAYPLWSQTRLPRGVTAVREYRDPPQPRTSNSRCYNRCVVPSSNLQSRGRRGHPQCHLSERSWCASGVSLAPLTFGGHSVCVWGHPEHCRMYSSTAGLYPLSPVASPPTA